MFETKSNQFEEDNNFLPQIDSIWFYQNIPSFIFGIILLIVRYFSDEHIIIELIITPSISNRTSVN